MLIAESRLLHIEALVAEYKNATAFCAAAGISPSYLSQLRGGSKTLGPGLSRSIEEKLKLAAGFFDQPHQAVITVKVAANMLSKEAVSVAAVFDTLPSAIKGPLKQLIFSLSVAPVADVA